MALPIKHSLTKERALQKIKHYCAYQERCHHEVKQKLFEMGIYRTAADELTSVLIEENYLNEERFAIQFAGGKFRMKYWGRVKIRYELQQKQISEYCIKKALLEIDDDDYLNTLDRLLAEKQCLLSEEVNPFVKSRKLYNYLLQKGFESDLIKAAIKRGLTLL